MKQPTTDALRVSHESLHSFAHQALQGAGMSETHAALVARLLATNDLRGVLSHGTKQLHRYVDEMRTGRVNPRPDVQTVHETDNSLLIDGDGGLGYMPLHDGTRRAIEKARTHGMAMVVTRSHGHIGAAGLYPRLAAESDFCAFATSGVQLRMSPGDDTYRAGGSSPMAFATPTSKAPPHVMDCGVLHQLQGRTTELREQIERLSPSIVLRLIGFGTVCQSWGGLLTGMPVDQHKAQRQWTAANQGGMLYVFDPGLFIDRDQFKREMDEYAEQVRQLAPIEGTEGAYLPGDVEAAREATYRREGVPVSERHREALTHVATTLELDLPW